MTSFAIMVHGSPSASQSATTALAFVTAAVTAGHRVGRVFFFHEGVLCGHEGLDSPTGSLAQSWRRLAEDHAIDLVLCAPSAIKRGVLDADQAHRQDGVTTALPPFALSGLGQWVEAAAAADRVVTFGS